MPRKEEGSKNYFSLLAAKKKVNRWKSQRHSTEVSETPRSGEQEGWDAVYVRASAPDGSTVMLGIRKLYQKPPLAEVTVRIKLPDGTAYKLPQHPDTVVGPWKDINRGWSAGGLKIEVLEHQMRLRILYNGLLKREDDDVTQHVRFNFIWSSASLALQHPDDWSEELASQAFTLQPSSGGDWATLLTILSWILPLCRRTVRHREITKSHLILAVHKLRLALLRLGKLMVKQWYLPEEDLVFHFRLNELRERKTWISAMQRRQYHPSWCKLKFAEMHTGWVEPLQSKEPLLISGDVRLQAMAVCTGEVVARACVVKDLSEIGQLRRGDVLVTHSTDIGWSPYFPLLTGIVTELGGLISHGAVIAREYGLPCLVGATNATDMFKTGDTVRLDATIGVLEKVQLIEEPCDDNKLNATKDSEPEDSFSDSEKKITTDTFAIL